MPYILRSQARAAVEPAARDRFGSGFNQNAIRRGGVVYSIVKHSVRTETNAVKAASEEAIKSLKAAVARRVLPQSVIACSEEPDLNIAPLEAREAVEDLEAALRAAPPFNMKVEVVSEEII